MSRHKSIGMPDYAVKLIDNWIAVAHSGQSVVPRDFYREVDLHESRPEPNAVWAAAVETIYRELWESDRTAALCVAALTFGAPKNKLRALGASRDQADTWLWLFGYEVNRIDLSKITVSAKLNLEPTSRHVISSEFGDLRKPLPRERIHRDSTVWQGGVKVSDTFN